MQTRRRLMRTALWAGAASVLPRALRGAAKAGPDKRPNLVVLFIDDLGWKDVRYRRGDHDTPCMDRLAAESMVFTDAYAVSPTCSPSRASLVTGQHPARLRIVRHIPGGDAFGRHVEAFHVRGADPARFPSRNWLPLSETTIAKALKPLGYRSAFVGKWHLGHEPYHPVRHGFDVQYGVSNYGHPIGGYYPPYFGPRCETYKDVPKDKYLTDQLTDDAVAYIAAADAERPFLLTLFYYAVHTPLQGRKDLLARGRAKGRGGQKLQHAAMMEAVDESVGRIRKALAAKGLADRTVVLLLGDQGSLLPGPPLRGGKRGGTALYEGGARVPFFVHWPGVTKAGASSSVPVSTTDVFPTLLDIAGARPADYPKLDGESLLPLLQRTGSLARKHVFLYRSYEGQYAAVRSGKWKLIAYRSGKAELYDLERDLSESTDLASKHPEQVKQLQAALAAWERKVGVAMPGKS